MHGTARRYVGRFKETIASWKSHLVPGHNNTIPGAYLTSVINRLELVKLPFVELKPVVSMAFYSARAILHGRGADVLELVRENI